MPKRPGDSGREKKDRTDSQNSFFEDTPEHGSENDFITNRAETQQHFEFDAVPKVHGSDEARCEKTKNTDIGPETQNTHSSNDVIEPSLQKVIGKSDNDGKGSTEVPFKSKNEGANEEALGNAQRPQESTATAAAAAIDVTKIDVLENIEEDKVMRMFRLAVRRAFEDGLADIRRRLDERDALIKEIKKKRSNEMTSGKGSSSANSQQDPSSFAKTHPPRGSSQQHVPREYEEVLSRAELLRASAAAAAVVGSEGSSMYLSAVGESKAATLSTQSRSSTSSSSKNEKLKQAHIAPDTGLPNSKKKLSFSVSEKEKSPTTLTPSSSFYGNQAVRARSNTFLERQRVDNASTARQEPIRRIIPSAIALEAQSTLAEELLKQTGMDPAASSGTMWGSRGRNQSDSSANNNDRQADAATLSESLLDPAQQKTKRGQRSDREGPSDEQRASPTSLNPPQMGSASKNSNNANNKNNDATQPARQSRSNSFAPVRKSIRRSRLASSRASLAQGAGGGFSAYGSSLPHYSGNRNNNNTVDSPYTMNDNERLNLFAYQEQMNFLAGGRSMGVSVPPLSATAVGVPSRSDEDVGKKKQPTKVPNPERDSDAEDNKSKATTKKTSPRARGGADNNNYQYHNTSAYRRNKSSFAGARSSNSSGGIRSRSTEANNDFMYGDEKGASGDGQQYFMGWAGGGPNQLNGLLSLWHRFTQWLRDARTYDTDDSLVLFVDTLYVFFTMCATIILANLLVVYYPNSQNIAPLEDNDQHSFSNLYLQPTMLTCLQFPFSLWMATRPFVRYRHNKLVIIDDTQSLAMTYLSSKSFYWDAFMTVPVEAIFIGSRPESFVVLACRHLFRWPRCLTLLRSSNPFASLRIWYLFYIMFFGFISLVHCSAAIFPMIEGSVEGDVPFSFPLTYVTSLYLIVTSTTGVGYGDAYPTQPYSRTFIFILQYTGAFMFAGLTAYLSHLILRGDHQRSFVAGLRQTIRTAIIHYKLPWAIQKDIALSLQPTLEKHTEIEYFSQLLNQILPLRLAQEISIFQFAKMYITSVPCFRSLPNEVALRLAAISERRYYGRNEEIFRMGDMGDEMFLVLSGRLEVKGMRSGGVKVEVVEIPHNPHPERRKKSRSDRPVEYGFEEEPKREGPSSPALSTSGDGGSSYIGSFDYNYNSTSYNDFLLQPSSARLKSGLGGGGSKVSFEAFGNAEPTSRTSVHRLCVPKNYGTIARLRVGHHFGLPSIFEKTIRAVTVTPLYCAAEVLVLSRERFKVVCNEYPQYFEDLVDEQKVMLREVLPMTRQFKFAAMASKRAEELESREGKRSQKMTGADDDDDTEVEEGEGDDTDGVDYTKWFFELQTDFPLKMMRRPARAKVPT